VERHERDGGMNRTSRATAVSSSTKLPTRSGLLARPAVREVSLLAAGVGILAASAWLSVPFYPVPLTMQTLAVLLVGGLLGARRGVTSVAAYLALGMMGAPVFHGGVGGPVVIAGPTGGYLLGFLPAAFLMGLVASRVRTLARGRGRSWKELAALAGGALSAEAAIYVVGVPWLAFFTGGLGQAVSVGVVPFLLGDLLKTAVAVGALRLGSRRSLGRESLPF
jgi:biotin transport system substrate-specific component